MRHDDDHESKDRRDCVAQREVPQEQIDVLKPPSAAPETHDADRNQKRGYQAVGLLKLAELDEHG